MINDIEYLFPNPLYVSSSLTLYHCGFESCNPKHDFGPAIRPHYLFHYILSGKGKFYAGDKCYSLKEKQGFLICPGDSTYYIADENEPWNYFWFGFNGYEAEAILKKCNLSIENPIFNNKTDNGLEHELVNLIKLFESSTYNEFEAIGQLYMIFAKMHSINILESKAQEKTYIDQAIEFILNNYTYNIKISDIAKYIGIDRTYLYKIFIRFYNLSPQQYLINFRLHIACNLLENSNLSITEISYSSGFKDIPSFYKHFKKVYKITPAKHRCNFKQ